MANGIRFDRTTKTKQSVSKYVYSTKNRDLKFAYETKTVTGWKTHCRVFKKKPADTQQELKTMHVIIRQMAKAMYVFKHKQLRKDEFHWRLSVLCLVRSS